MVWRCDFCGGPASWCIVRGEALYHCRRECDGFMQMELFSSDRVPEVHEGDDQIRTWRPNIRNTARLPDGLPFE